MILKGAFIIHDRATGKQISYVSSKTLKRKYKEFGREKFLKIIDDRIIHTSKDGNDFIKKVKKNEL